MKTLTTFAFLMLAQLANSQYAMYHFDSIAAPTNLLGSKVYHHLLLPQEIDTSASKQSFPLVILFDQQNKFTTQYNFGSIDILTMHTQMPQCVVVGIPLENNRWELTSTDTLIPEAQQSGAEMLHAYLMQELIPIVQKKFHANGPVIVIGHSRTGYFTHYLQEKNGDRFEAIGSFSAFFENEITAYSVFNAIQNRPINQRAIQYISAGTSLEEATYLNALHQMQTICNTDSALTTNIHFRKGIHETHMTNYNMSLPWMLIDYFATYSLVLEDWLFHKCDQFTTSEALNQFKKDLEQLKIFYKKEIIPNPVHIYSIASNYYNKGDLATCNLFLEYGRTFYPNETDMQPWE